MAHRSLGLPSPAPGSAAGTGRWRSLAGDLAPWLVARLLEERERWLLWLPVAMGTGVALSFALPAEPPLWPGAAGVLLISAVLLWLRWRAPDGPSAGWAPVLLGLAMLMAGFGVATLRTHLIAAPVL